MNKNKFIGRLENERVVQDITELERNIQDYLFGKTPDDRFRGQRTSRGVYSQRQQGVQMVRIKLPLGKINFAQLLCMAEAADEYANGLLHLTTRQDVQIYYVPLLKTPELWAKLETEGITLRGSGGNTVRNVTASPEAGIDPLEPFDVTPYAYEVFTYFLYNPVSQEMGRKVKIAFSSNEADTALTYIHDLGFIPKIKEVNGEEKRGFKTLIGGGLGAQPALAHVAYEFLPEDQLIPFIESLLRVFDRYGERNNRNKARLKFLVHDHGVENVLRLAEQEKVANGSKSYRVNTEPEGMPGLPQEEIYPAVIADHQLYRQWLGTNVIKQKQKGFYGVFIKVPGGDLSARLARKLVDAVRPLAADEIRITPSQGLLLKYVRMEALPALFNSLQELKLAEPGFDSTAHIITCRGTNTCNLAIGNSLSLAKVLEEVIGNEYQSLISNRDIKIRISGCMNSCGQHGLAQIGFHGSSIKTGGKVLPAVQVLLGGGTVGDGRGRIAEKIIKVPTRRAPGVLRQLLDDYHTNALLSESFHQYYDRKGRVFFYNLLKPLANLTSVTDEDFMDLGSEETYKTAIGKGECAGTVLDLSGTLLQDAFNKLEKAKATLEANAYADSIFYSYSAFICAAKAVLLHKGVNSGTHHGIITEFDKYFFEYVEACGYDSFYEMVLQINREEPGATFAQTYLQEAIDFAEGLKREIDVQGPAS